jgi:hypothetical protein
MEKSSPQLGEKVTCPHIHQRLDQGKISSCKKPKMAYKFIASIILDFESKSICNFPQTISIDIYGP